MLRTLLFSSALLSAAACLPLHAGAPVGVGLVGVGPVDAGLVDVGLIDRETGQRLPEYAHRGRVYVPGEPGHRYAVRLFNLTGERVLVVLSVDGVNAVTGETAAASQAGYVLSPWEHAEIAGWRKSLDDVAQFHFTDLPDSYAARTGRPDNVGVVGIAVFGEHRQPLPPPPVARGERARDAAQASVAREPASSADGASAPQRLGTGHGAREWAPVGRTFFARASTRPVQVTELRYDDRDALAAQGIVPRRDWRHWRDPEPRAFPDGFVADPPGW